MIKLKNSYQPSTETTKVMLIYLLLNGGDFTKVESTTQVHQKMDDGSSLRKFVSETREFFDVRKIEEEIKNHVVPVLHNEESFQYANTAPIIYDYRAQHGEHPMLINDMDVITRNMYISDDQIISENLAKPLMDCNNRGFMFFCDYVLNNRCEVGKWIITYENETLTICYDSFTRGEDAETATVYPIFEAEKVTKKDTFPLVIYTIIKASLTVDEWSPDNFNVVKYVKTGER